MCGIAGVVHADPKRRARISEMLECMIHRGPDDSGTADAAGGVLGQRRLSIIDLPGGRQPIANADETKWVVCNGEIYNYRELQAELRSDGTRLRTESDTEVILHLYEKYGVECLDRLRGMFAFAIWDARTQTLFCARDRLGQKPFFYTHDDSGFAFSSEIKGLLAYDSGLRRLNVRALDQYLSLRIVASPDAMFDGIRKLPPAHYLLYQPSRGLEIRSYWDLHYEPKHIGSENQLIDELEERIVEALRLHMVADVPVGAFMSGGLDSTLVVAMLTKHVCTEPLRTFTMGLAYRQFDEAPAARLVAQKYGTRHHEETVTPSLLSHLPDLVWHLDEPSDPLSICTYLLAEFASRHVKVVLGGDGGDELFGGYDRYYGNLYAGYFAKVPAAIRRRVFGTALNALPDGRWYKSAAHQLKWLHELSFFEGGDRYAHSLGYFYFGADWAHRIYGEAMLSKVGSFDAGRPIVTAFDDADARHPIDRMLHADSFVRLPDHPVMITDRMTMAHSLEARSPFMDHKLAEYAARLPVTLKIRGRSLRYAQRRLAERYLPREVLDRPKQGFASALPYLLRDEYEQLTDSLLRDSTLARDGYLNQAGIDSTVREHRAGARDHGNRLWLLVNAEAWYRLHFAGHGREDLQRAIHAHTVAERKEPGTVAL